MFYSVSVIEKKEEKRCRTPKVSKKLTFRVFFLVKYSEGFKLQIIKECAEGSLGYNLLAKKYGVPNQAQIERWGHAYKAFGRERLRKKPFREVFSVQFKMDVLHFMKQTGASNQETAIEFNLHNPTLIAN